MKETGFLQFPGVVKPSQYNFAGLDTTGAVLEDGSIDVGRSYSGVREGIRAHVQRLKAYAAKGTTPTSFAYPCIDKDKYDSSWWRNTIVGSSPYVEWLGKSQNPSGFGWATDPNYGYSIKNDYMAKLLKY
ncbi:MAG: glucosaminidase domain-containing protein [Lachnospiraceae bacterium]|nr:glucosaminidase domain-containing protein [Lachnospiraceae bacterium]